MASSSQACSGTWADLPQAPSSGSRPIVGAQNGSRWAACSPTTVNFELPNIASMLKIAMVMPRSPTRFITNALVPAAAADALCCQKLIRR